MALCSQAFNTAAKRTCHFGNAAPSPSKRICLSKLASPRKSVVCYSSSETDNDSEDEQSCYNADQVKAKRRASTRVSFSLNSELSRAVSKYSDDDEDDCESDLRNVNDENIDCRLSSSPSSSSLLFAVNPNHAVVGNNTSFVNTPPSHNNASNSSVFLQISDHASSPASKKLVPESDKGSRSRCFEYLVGAIDEAWARYCDATTYVEDEVYGYNTPASVATDDEDYFGNTTDITDYESDFEVAKPSASKHQRSSKPSMLGNSNTSKDPSSCQLQALKDRLTKAKYFLQDLVDSDDFADVIAFWKRWDMIKYATIELVEDDDDDEVVESTIDELEDGRLFAN